MTDQPYTYTDRDTDTLTITAIPDASGYYGPHPVVSVHVAEHQGDETATVHIELDDVPQVIEALRDALTDLRHAARQDCGFRDCGPCSFDRAVPTAAERDEAAGSPA
jgi:hypothetical protein